MKGFLFSILAVWAVSAFAQTTLSGYVTLQNSGGKSAFPAQVKSFGATATDVGRDNGRFDLKYDRRRPGEEISLDIEKDDYEVVNISNLSVRLPKDEVNQRPVKIYLCPRGQWRKYADQYYGTNIRAINANYGKEIKRIQAQYAQVNTENEAYRKALFELGQQYEAALDQAQEMAERFAKANLDDATDRYVLAHRLFTAGKIDSVLMILNEKEILADIKKAETEIAAGQALVAIGEGKLVNGQEAKEKIIEEFMIKARAHIIKLEWINAQHAYEVAIRADSSHAENWFEYAMFLQEQKQYNAAQPIYEHCLSLQKAEYNVANILNNLAMLYYNKNDFMQAEKNYLRVLEIYEKLTKENSFIYDYDIAGVLNNLSVLYYNNKNLLKAEIIYSQALEIYERLAKENIRAYAPDIAGILNNLGALYYEKNDFQQAEKKFLRALEIREQLARENPRMYASDLTVTLNNLGVLYKDKNAYLQGENSYLRALEIRERLAKENPRMYEPDVATTLNNLGILYKAKNNFPQAEKSYLRALEVFERLAKENPETYEPNVAATLNNLGILYKAKHDFPQAEESCLRALEIYERLAKKNPRTYEPVVAMTLNNLGTLYEAKNNFLKSEINYLRALRIRERLAKENPRIYEPDVAATLNNLGLLYQAKNDFPRAEKSYLRTREIRERLAKENRGVYEPDLAATLNNLANLYSDKHDFPLAEKNYLRALEMYERLVKENPPIYEPDLAATLNNLADLYYAKNDFPQAETSYLRALEVYEHLSEETPQTYEPDVAETLNNLGLLYQAKHDFPQAEKNYLRALEIAERLSKENQFNLNIILCKTYLFLSLYCKDLLAFSKGEEIWRKQGMEWLQKAAATLTIYPEDFEPGMQLTQAILGIANELQQYDASLAAYQEQISEQEAVIEAIKHDGDKVQAQHALVQIYEKAQQESPASESVAQKLSNAYGNLAWYALFARDFPLAEASARNAIQTHPSADWVHTNLALALLYQGKYEAAKAIYADRKGKPYDEKRTWTEVFLTDLKALKEAGITHPDAAKIQAFLKK